MNAPIRFDPVQSTLPEGVLLPPSASGEVVALLVDPGTGMDGWPPRVARSVARTWAERDRSVVLLDAHIERPALHHLLGASNTEGITDAVEYGASLSRVTQSLESEPFDFIPAGTVLSDPREFWRSRRWNALMDRARKEQRVLLLYLPASEPEINSVVRQADRSFWVGRPDAPDAAQYPGIRAIVPPRSPEDRDAAADPAVEDRYRSPSGLIGSTQETIAPKPEREREQARPQNPTRPRPASSPGGARPVGTRRSTPWILLILVLILAGGVIGHWFGVFTIPGLPVRMEPAETGLLGLLSPLR